MKIRCPIILIAIIIIVEMLLVQSYNIASPHGFNVVLFRRRTIRLRLDGIYNPIYLLCLYKIIKFIAKHREDFSLHNIEIGRRVVMDRVKQLIEDDDDNEVKDSDYPSNSYNDEEMYYNSYYPESRFPRNEDVENWLNSFSEEN